jgi:hypothetical protein
VLSLLHLVGFSGVALIVATKVLATGLLCLCAVRSVRLAELLGPEPRADARWSVAAGVVVGILPSLSLSALSGMEVTLAAWITVEFLVAGLQPRPRRAALALLAAAAVLARPELALVLGVWGVWRLTRGRWADVAVAGGASAGALLAWFAYCYAVTGHPLPNTHYVKSGGAGLEVALLYFWQDVLLEEFWVLTFVPVVLVFLGVQNRRSLVVLLSVLAVWVGILLNHRLTPGVLFHMSRYFYVVLPLLAVLGVLGAERVWRWCAGRERLRQIAGVALLVSLAATAGAEAWSKASIHASDCASTRILHVQPAQWLRERTGPADTLAVAGAGALRLVTQRRCIDLLGLNSHQIAHVFDDVDALYCAIASDQPSWVVAPSYWGERLEGLFEMRAEHRTRVAAWTIARPFGPREMVVWRVRIRPEVAAECRRRARPSR